MEFIGSSSGRRPWERLLVMLAIGLVWVFPLTVRSYTSNLPGIENRFHATKLFASQPSPSEEQSHSTFVVTDRTAEEPEDDTLTDTDQRGSSRRQFLQTLALASVVIPASHALAGKPEYDKVTGSLYTPKAEMLSGGSAAARGTVLSASSSATQLQPGKALQTVYETRFITYLSRFLLTYDPSANAWWVQNAGLADTWDLGSGSSNTVREGLTRDEVNAKFAEFAESVEIGLADYFVGPYGSYGSVTAAAAGIGAKLQVKSSRPSDSPPQLLNLFGELWTGFRWNGGANRKDRLARDRESIAKQGVLNLYTLLKARYTSNAAKRQLAILFSFFSNGNIQPTAEIESLLGEADNATVSRIDWVRPPLAQNSKAFRASSRLGGGYSISQPPSVTVDPPPALGSSYQSAKAKAILEPTSRILRMKVTDGGEGYTSIPDVTVFSGGASRTCSACAILDREGHVADVLVLDPGLGYGKVVSRSAQREPPRVTIAPPQGTGRRAMAMAELEYEIVGINLLEGGNGYVSTEPPVVRVSQPEDDPDWFVEIRDLKDLLTEFGPVRAEVAEMRSPTGNLAFSIGNGPTPSIPPVGSLQMTLSQYLVERIRRDPIELLPSSVRPVRNSLGEYIIPSIAAVPTYTTSPNPRYRAVDPLFGSIGSVPVTKSALELKPSEYGRLALSGAVCTVLVRTALNPLELIKTKQQLRNDEELFDFATDKIKDKIQNTPSNSTGDSADAYNSTEITLGSTDLIKSLVELRGPAALFQSADITFLASLMFGSFGFGATELFRRSFTIFSLNEGGDSNSEVILLLAATLATVITSFFAAPFELLRVRSMGLVNNKSWTEVLGDFVQEKSGGSEKKIQSAQNGTGEFSLSDLTFKDILPLWAGFPPTASRELAFAIPKFLAFDVLAKLLTRLINAQAGPGSLPIQVGIGTAGLAISAIAGAVAGVAGALVSHPADLILTYTSAASKKSDGDDTDAKGVDWRDVVKDLLSKEGGISNLFIGLQPRLVFFFLVIGLQFFLYDYVKNLLNVGSDDLSLVLDVFYAVRQGLLDTI